MSDVPETAGLPFPTSRLSGQTYADAVGLPRTDEAAPLITLTYSDRRLARAESEGFDPMKKVGDRLKAARHVPYCSLEEVVGERREYNSEWRLHLRFRDHESASVFCRAVEGGAIVLNGADCEAVVRDPKMIASLAGADGGTPECPECGSSESVGELPSGEFMCRDCVEVFSDE